MQIRQTDRSVLKARTNCFEYGKKIISSRTYHVPDCAAVTSLHTQFLSFFSSLDIYSMIYCRRGVEHTAWHTLSKKLV
jgi:predicted metal-binding protein